MNTIIVQSARLHCTRDRAFQLFTDNASLQSWLTTIADVEPEVGGKYELFWDTKTREMNSTLGCKVTAIESGTFVSFEWKGPPAFQHVMNMADPLTQVVVFFTPCQEVFPPCTDVYLIHSGWGSSAEWEQARQYFVRAWGLAFEELVRVVNGEPA